MPATPQITLTATLQSFSGVEAGTTANPAKLQIALCNFGLNIPRVIGTSVLAQIQYEALDSGTGISVQLYGNDQITPQTATGTPQTYYAITVLDGEGNTVQCAAYQFTGTQTIDLSNAIPIPPPPPPTPNPAGNTWAFDIEPDGVIDGNNLVFTLPYVPSPPTSLDLFKGGSRLTAGIGYTLTGLTITYTEGYQPWPGDSHICNFLYAASTAAPAGPIWAFDVVPGGVIDGINPTFTLPFTPNPATSLNLFKSSSRMTAGIAFTLTGDTITYEPDYIPQPPPEPGQLGDSHICNFLHL